MKSVSKIRNHKQIHRNRKLLVKHILSFSFVLFCIALMVSFLFKTFLLKNLNEFNDKLQYGALDTSTKKVFMEFEQLQNLLEQAALRKELNPVRVNKGAAAMSEAQTALRQLIRTNELIEECIILSDQYNLAFSDLTSYRIDYFLDNVQSHLLASCTSYSDVLQILRQYPFIPVEVRGTSMLAINMYFNGGYAMTLVKADDIFRLFNEQVPNTEKTYSVIYLNEVTFLSSIPSDDDTPKLHELRNAHTINIQESKYRVLLKEFPEVEICFAYLTDKDFYLDSVQRTTRQSLLGLLIIFIIGSAILTILAYYNYKPINALRSALEKFLKKEPSEKQNELHFIACGIDQLIEDNVKLSNRLDVEKGQLKNFCLFKLLHSPITDIEATKRTLEEVDIHFDRECFQCISLSLLHAVDINLFTQRIAEERDSRSPYCSLYYLINGTDFVLIFNFSQQDSETVHFLIENFSKYYIQEIDMAMGIGSIAYSINELSHSYSQSQIALRYAEASKEENLSQFDGIPLVDTLEKLYNSNQVSSLLAAIHNNDLKSITKTLNEIKCFIQDSQMPRYAIKAMYYQIVNSVLASSRNPVLFEKGNDILMAIGEALQKYTLDELHSQIESFCYQMVHQTSSIVLLDKFLDYISQHYTDVNFSISGMAEHFNMSHQKMSSVFKRETHLNIIDYITNCRISMATDLLINTLLSIAEIVKKVGYIDNSSFTRKFKSITGMTPIEYRRRYSSSSNH